MDADKLLEQLGVKNVKYEDLTPDERETFHVMYDAFVQNQLTIDRIKDHITMMKQGVEQELTRHDLDPKQDIFLKARLRNYMLLEAFLISPEKAKKQLERALENVKRR